LEETTLRNYLSNGEETTCSIVEVNVNVKSGGYLIGGWH
jgi:hypothetical protein